MKSLTFQSTKFDIIDRSGQSWLRSPQIADALGYKSGRQRISQLYRQHAAEFTDSMTGVVKLTTPSGEQEVRIFSLRGAHLLGMFARTAKAQEFRRWVLDVLEKEAAPPKVGAGGTATKALPAPEAISRALRQAINRKAHTVAVKQYDTIHAIIEAAVLDNLACGATEEACFGYVETYGDLADGTVVANIRDLQELVHAVGFAVDQAGTAIAAIKRIEKRSGFTLYHRNQPSKKVSPEFHKNDRLIREVIDRMV